MNEKALLNVTHPPPARKKNSNTLPNFFFLPLEGGEGGGRRKEKEEEEVMMRGEKFMQEFSSDPTNNALLIDFLLSSDAENLVAKHRRSMQKRRGTCKKTCAQTCPCSDWASILHSTVGGWVGRVCVCVWRRLWSKKVDLFFLFFLLPLPPCQCHWSN